MYYLGKCTHYTCLMYSTYWIHLVYVRTSHTGLNKDLFVLNQYSMYFLCSVITIKCSLSLSLKVLKVSDMQYSIIQTERAWQSRRFLDSITFNRYQSCSTLLSLHCNKLKIHFIVVFSYGVQLGKYVTGACIAKWLERATVICNSVKDHSLVSSENS